MPARAQGQRPATATPTASSWPRCSTRSASASAALFCRAPLVLPAHLRPVGDAEEPWTTFTRDISAGGLRVARQSGYREAGEHEVVIGLVQANREIRGRASRGARTDTDVSLSFTDDRGRGSAAARAADVRLPPPQRRQLTAWHARRRSRLWSDRVSRSFRLGGGCMARFCPGLGDRQRR